MCILNRFVNLIIGEIDVLLCRNLFYNQIKYIGRSYKVVAANYYLFCKNKNSSEVLSDKPIIWQNT